MFAALGAQVTVVDARDDDARLLRPGDRRGAPLPPPRAERRRSASASASSESKRARRGTLTTLASGKLIPADVVFYSAGRQGAITDLDLENAGLERRRARPHPGRRALPHARCRTSTRSATSSASRASRRPRRSRAASPRATSSASPTQGGERAAADRHLLDPGDQLRREDRAGADRGDDPVRGRHRALPRARARPDPRREPRAREAARLADDRTLLGVHAFGAGATEVVHIGQAVMGLGGTIDYLVESVFNYPTFAEAYKVAALDALNKLRAVTLAERARTSRSLSRLRACSEAAHPQTVTEVGRRCDGRGGSGCRRADLRPFARAEMSPRGELSRADGARRRRASETSLRRLRDRCA